MKEGAPVQFEAVLEVAGRAKRLLQHVAGVICPEWNDVGYVAETGLRRQVPELGLRRSPSPGGDMRMVPGVSGVALDGPGCLQIVSLACELTPKRLHALTYRGPSVTHLSHGEEEFGLGEPQREHSSLDQPSMAPCARVGSAVSWHGLASPSINPQDAWPPWAAGLDRNRRYKIKISRTGVNVHRCAPLGGVPTLRQCVVVRLRREVIGRAMGSLTSSRGRRLWSTGSATGGPRPPGAVGFTWDRGVSGLAMTRQPPIEAHPTLRSHAGLWMSSVAARIHRRLRGHEMLPAVEVGGRYPASCMSKGPERRTQHPSAIHGGPGFVLAVHPALPDHASTVIEVTCSVGRGTSERPRRERSRNRFSDATPK